MSIEVANESGVAVDESAARLRRAVRARRHAGQPGRRAVDHRGHHRGHDRAARALDGRARPHRRHVVPDGRAGRRVPPPGRPRDRARRCSATSCSAPTFAAAQARKAGHGLADELHLLTVHGVLHLLGYDHAEPEQEREMFGLQNALLADWQAARQRGRRARGPAPPRLAAARHGRARGLLSLPIDMSTRRPDRRRRRCWSRWPGCSPRPTPRSTRSRAPASRRARPRGPRRRPGAGRGRRRPSRGTSTCSCCCGWPPRPPRRCCSRSRSPA